MVRMKNTGGYGIVPRNVMRDNTISASAKAIYAYLCVFAGDGDEAYPTYKTMSTELGMSEPTVSKHLKALKERRLIEVRKAFGGNNVYRIMGLDNFEIVEKGCTVVDTEEVEVSDTEEPKTDPKEEDKPKERKDYQTILEKWNELGIDGISTLRSISPRRKKHLQARMKDGFDIDEVISMIKKSQFLWDQNWFTFDWIIKNEDNYTKLMEGKYASKSPKKTSKGYENVGGETSKPSSRRGYERV